MKSAIAAFAALALLAPQTLANEVRVTMTGVVDSNNWTAAPYDTVAVGSSVSMSFNVTTPGNPSSPGELYYNFDHTTWELEFENTPSLRMPSSYNDLMTLNDWSGTYTLTSYGSMPIEQNFTCSFGWTLPSTTFGSIDLEQEAGIHDASGSTGTWVVFGPNGDILMDLQSIRIDPPFTGTAFCDPMNSNSTGVPTQLSAHRQIGVASGLHLEGSDGPAGKFGYILVGSAFSNPGLPISDGRLCLSGSLGRYNVNGTDMNSVGIFDAYGTFQNLANTSVLGSGFDVPTTLPLVANPTIAGGQTWHFQLWHREANGHSNFSNGTSVAF